MYMDLWGNVREDKRDVAMKIIRETINDPFYQISFDNMGNLCYTDGNGSRVSLQTPGLYAIYCGQDCLYVGHSMTAIGYRVYRFFKELQGMSRRDESHPAAKKARKAGYKINQDYQIKIYTKIDGLAVEDVDEYIAPLLKSKFNKKIRK